MGKELIQVEIKYHETILDFIEKAKGIHNMQCTLLLVNDQEKRSRNFHNTVLEK